MIRLSAALAFGAGGNGNAALRTGWSAPEDGFVWSAGRVSILHLPLPSSPDGVLLELAMTPYLHGPALIRQCVGVSVNGMHVAERELREAVRWLLELPAACLKNAAAFELTLHLPDAVAPAAFGDSNDSRILGIRLDRLVLLHDPGRAALPLRAGRLRLLECFEFGANQTTAPMLGEGWSKPEGGHVTALGRHSVLRLDVPKDPGALSIILDMKALGGAGTARPQRIAMGANGRLLDYIALGDQTALALDLPDHPGGGPLEIAFDNLDAGDPNNALWPDGRPMIFMLFRLHLLQEHGAPAWNAAYRAPIGAMSAASFGPEVTHFESLGNLCELGLLQRKFGYEPAGLLRFAGIRTPHLVETLRNGFLGLGRPDTLDISVRDDDQRGYVVIDGPTSIAVQTPVSAVTVSEAALRRQVGRNFPFLARKYLEDVVAGNKIFVFHRRDPTTEPEARAVLAALAQWGDPTVLWVQFDPAEPPGGVLRLGPRLLRGFLGVPREPYRYASEESWISVLVNALAMVRLGGQCLSPQTPRHKLKASS